MKIRTLNISVIAKILFIFITVSLLVSCANMGTPSGGNKDTQPPKVVESNPANSSTNFHEKEIIITFDEYIVLKNVNSKLIVSPPLDEKPKIKQKGKSIEISIIGELADSTTYTFNFGDAIVDNNEGNAIKNFMFTFSTGPVIDSLSIAGTINNAFTNLPEEEVLIMAYINHDDSIPINEKPLYITRSLKDGSFIITNMRQATYKLFAIVDANNNYKFDIIDEPIAFADSLITPTVIITEIIDTIQIDTLGTDSIITKFHFKNYPDSIKLMLFEEDDSRQYLKNSSRKKKNRLLFAFNKELTKPVDLQLINNKYDAFIFENIKTKDSVIAWITDSAIYNIDSLRVLLTYEKTDSLGNYFSTIDTLVLAFREKAGKKNKTDKKDDLKLRITPKTGHNLEISKNIELQFSSPITRVDTSLISVAVQIDTLFVPIEYTLIPDTLNLRKYYFKIARKENQRYKVTVEDSAFMDITDNLNDSTGTAFTARATDYYGSVILNLKDIKDNSIIQLQDSKDKVISEQYADKPITISFNFLLPGKYKLKYIEDKNNNKKWDTGKYLDKLQPEKTEYYTKEIIVKSNWELEIEWAIGK